jgi:hypothetical protein
VQGALNVGRKSRPLLATLPSAHSRISVSPEGGNGTVRVPVEGAPVKLARTVEPRSPAPLAPRASHERPGAHWIQLAPVSVQGLGSYPPLVYCAGLN